MKKYLVANWKMYTTYTEAMELVDYYKSHLKSTSNLKIIICPPAIWLESICKKLNKTNIGLGIQNIHHAKEGAFTGEISALMAKKFAKYVIVGHSERKILYRENNEAINQKVKIALKNKLKPIVCFGEKYEDEGIDHILAQVSMATKGLSKDEIKKIIFAYEPIWAIGTGKVATSDHARRIIISARERLSIVYNRDLANKLVFLYGGSVHSKNINQFLDESEINGFLVGGASIEPEVINRIYKIIDEK